MKKKIIALLLATLILALSLASCKRGASTTAVHSTKATAQTLGSSQAVGGTTGGNSIVSGGGKKMIQACVATAVLVYNDTIYYCEFNDFTILTEVTMSTSSRQEAMEGEPVRRHVSDAVLKYDKPVYGMFIAVRIDTNTAETFRHGIWYAKGDVKQRLDIVPLTLAQFQKYFVAMFEADKAQPEHLRDLILTCETRRDILEAPAWKQYSTLSTLDETYLGMLQGWLRYLQVGESQYIDYAENESEEELLDKIKSYY